MDSSTPTGDHHASPHRHGVSCAVTASAGSVTNPYAKIKTGTRPPNPKPKPTSEIPTLPAAPGAASHPDGSNCAVRPRKRAWHSSHSYAENAPAPSASRQRPPRSEPVLHRGHDTTDPTSQKTGNTGRKLRGGKRKRQSTIITIPVGGTSASADAAADSKKSPPGLPGSRGFVRGVGSQTSIPNHIKNIKLPINKQESLRRALESLERAHQSHQPDALRRFRGCPCTPPTRTARPREDPRAIRSTSSMNPRRDRRRRGAARRGQSASSARTGTFGTSWARTVFVHLQETYIGHPDGHFVNENHV